jgi:hypothetical protein
MRLVLKRYRVSGRLTAVQVAGDLIRGALADARRHLAAATGAVAAVPADRRGRVQVMLAVAGNLLT